MDPAALVALGVVTKPHGVHGEVRVHPFNPDSRLLLACDAFVLRDEDGATFEGEVERAERGPKYVRLKLRGCDSREDADELRGLELCVPRAALPPPSDGEWYFVDLEGLAVVDEAGAALGAVLEVVALPSVDCLRVSLEEGVVEVPMVAPWLVEVDLPGGRVVVSSLEDLPREGER